MHRPVRELLVRILQPLARRLCLRGDRRPRNAPRTRRTAPRPVLGRTTRTRGDQDRTAVPLRRTPQTKRRRIRHNHAPAGTNPAGGDPTPLDRRRPRNHHHDANPGGSTDPTDRLVRGKEMAVGAEDRAVGGARGGGDNQVKGAARFALRPHRHEQLGVLLGVLLGDLDMVVEDRHSCDDVVDVGRPYGLACAVGAQGSDTQGSDAQLADRRSGHGHIVVIIDELIQFATDPFASIRKAVSIRKAASKSSRVTAAHRSQGAPGVASRSPDQSASGRCRLSSAVTSAPRHRCIGSICAIARPRRTMVKCSPRCSIASNRSAKFRTASVAVTSVMKS